MTNNEQPAAQEPSTPTPVTRERLVEILEAENLQYRLDDDNDPNVVFTGFIDTAIGFALEQDAILFNCQWRGLPDASHAPKALAAVNEWNLTQIAPILSFAEAQPGKLTFLGHRKMLAGDGLDRNQIGAFMMSSIAAARECFQWLASQFPECVDWEESNS